MRTTGIVRRVDDLGRIIIPKDVRRTLNIREGDPLEVFVGKDGSVTFKKFSPLNEEAENKKEQVIIGTNGLTAILRSFFPQTFNV